MTLTVGSATLATPASSTDKNNAILMDNLEIQQEMIRLINQIRKANGVSELPVSDALMNAAQHAVTNWINSFGHFQTMIDPDCDCIGVGITQHDRVTYCYMFVGIPNSINFYG